jgi:oligopeptide transport system substrate-binding protein
MKIYYHTLLLLLTALIVQCGQPKDNEDDLKGKKIFRYNESAGITTLDPALVRRFEDFLAIEQLFNGLVTLDESMKLSPALAHSWEISPDGKVYTFYLRTDVLFNNHELFEADSERKFTAKDAAFSFFRIIDPVTASPGKYIFDNLAFDASSGFKGIEAVNDSILKIYLKEPQPSFIYQLSLPYCVVVPSKIVDYYGNNFGQNPLGTGPFYVKKWKMDSKLVLLKNEDYFEKDSEGNPLPYIDAVAVTFINDPHIEFLQLKSGKLDMISGFNDNDKDELLDHDGNLQNSLKEQFYLQKTPWLNTDYIGILMDESFFAKSSNPLAEKKIRQAIAHCLDKYKLVKYTRNGVGKPANYGFVPLGMPGFDDIKIDGIKYDIEAAQKLLVEAGFPQGKGLPVIKLTAAESYKSLCEFIQTSCAEIGIKIEIVVVTAAVLNQHIAQFEAPFYRKSWIADFPDAINYFQLFYSGNFYPENGSNYTHFKNEAFDNYYELSLKENNDSIRYTYYKEMQIILNDELPVIPLFYAETLRFVNNRVTGLQSNALNMLSLKSVQLKD